MSVSGIGRPGRVALAVVVGVLAFAAAQWTLRQSGETAEVIVVLDANEVDWQHHDAVREAALGLLTSDPQAAETVTALAGPNAEIDGQLLSGQSHFSFQVSADDASEAAIAADALMVWLIDQNLAEQRLPHTEELAVLAQSRTDLESRITAFEQDEGESDELAVARYLENTSLLAQYERRADEVQTELDLVRPQFGAASPAKVVGSSLRPWITALVAIVATLMAFVLFEPRAEAQ